MSTPLLDWTIGPAPTPDDDPPPNTAPRRPRPNPAAALRLSRRTWLLLGAVAVLALALIVVLPLVENARTRRAVEQVVAGQEAARLAGDWNTLSATYAADTVGWAVTRVLRLRNGWLPTPISLPGLRSDGRPGRVIRFQVIGPQLARADVERGFVLANGARATFGMPQFYQFVQGVWRQAPPPETSKDLAQHLHGPRVDLTYTPDDADLAALVANDLGDLLVRACFDWNCPPELHVAVDFNPNDPASAASPAAFDSLLGSLTLQIILGRPSTYPATSVSLASRLTGGYPTNPAASEAVRRAAGVRGLIVVAQQLAPNSLLHGENAYLDALIVREASRLGIDAPELRQMSIANPLFDPKDLWSVPQLHFASDGALPEALVILNHVLADRGLTDEQRLMHTLDTAGDAETWLAAGAGLGLGRAEVQARFNQMLDPAFPPVQWPSFAPDLALSCPTGPVLALLSGQTAPLLAGDYPDSPVDAWSPDGKRIALAVSDRRGIVAAGNPLGQFLPLPSFQTGLPATWASNTVLVYPPVHVYLLSNTLQTENLGLDFFDSFDRARTTRLDNLDTYLPSPNGVWAAVVGQPAGSDSALSIIPALGGTPIITATFGNNPSWSADSQHLAFALRDAGGSTELVVVDMATRDKRTIWFTGPSVGAQPAGGNTDLTSVMPAWSPAGDRMAVATVTGTGNGFVGWVGLVSPVSPDGGLRSTRLPVPRDGTFPDVLAYSADGAYLSVGLFDNIGAQGVALYSSAGALLRWLPGFQAGPWSPTGHTLALIGLDGASLLREPDAAPQAIGPANCTGLAWKP